MKVSEVLILTNISGRHLSSLVKRGKSRM